MRDAVLLVQTPFAMHSVVRGDYVLTLCGRITIIKGARTLKYSMSVARPRAQSPCMGTRLHDHIMRSKVDSHKASLYTIRDYAYVSGV